LLRDCIHNGSLQDGILELGEYFFVTDGASRRFQLELASVLWKRRVRIDLDVNAGGFP
jgi:hypothetical protein